MIIYDKIVVSTTEPKEKMILWYNPRKQDMFWYNDGWTSLTIFPNYRSIEKYVKEIKDIFQNLDIIELPTIIEDNKISIKANEEAIKANEETIRINEEAIKAVTDLLQQVYEDVTILKNKPYQSDGYTYNSQNNSFTVGKKAEASGDNSFASGFNSVAKGKQSTATGTETESQGRHTTSEGYQTLSYGPFSHSEGYKTKAIGRASHAQGIGNTANNQGQCVVGKYATIDNNGMSIFQVGIGSSEINRRDALKIDVEGNVTFGNSKGQTISLTFEELQKLKQFIKTI